VRNNLVEINQSSRMILDHVSPDVASLDPVRDRRRVHADVSSRLRDSNQSAHRSSSCPSIEGLLEYGPRVDGTRQQPGAQMRRFMTTLALLFLVAGGASAHQRDHRDPDDTRGRLDIRRVEWFNGSGRVMVTVRTHERFLGTDLQPFQGGMIVEVDTKGDGRADFYARFNYNDEEGIWCEVRNRRERLVGQGTATRESRAAICSFPRRWIDIERHLRWRVHTVLSSRTDSAPDRGWFDH